MLKYLFCIFLTSSFFYCTATTPLWEEDPHIIWYKVLMIENDIYQLEEQVHRLEDENIKDRIFFHIENIKFNLGTQENTTD